VQHKMVDGNEDFNISIIKSNNITASQIIRKISEDVVKWLEKYFAHNKTIQIIHWKKG